MIEPKVWTTARYTSFISLISIYVGAKVMGPIGVILDQQ